MKITVIGGGSVRSPLLVAAALRRASRIHLDEVCLMDIDQDKLDVFGGLSQVVARRMNSPVKLSLTTDPLAAMTGASYVITTIRVGGDQGRISDERIALKYGVLGQETTGPGGFAMALRSIPAILDYARLLFEINPQAWLFNFTNPAGLVTQALRDNGFTRTVGICDSANGAQHAASRYLGIEDKRLQGEVFGLNHLSWCRKVFLDGQDCLVRLLNEPAFLSGSNQAFFDPELIRQIGMFLNEYLFYYYYPEKAVSSILSEEMTRGEEILHLNRQFMRRMESIDLVKEPEKALEVHSTYTHRRSSTYMHYAQPGSPTPKEADHQFEDWIQQPSDIEGEGYAGVVLDIIEAFTSGIAMITGLNIPNEGMIDAMRPSDVVEISARVDSSGIHPLLIGAIPEHQELLMRSVKVYERLTVEAVQARSRQIAQAALMAHPLVQSYSRARLLVDDYLIAHAPYIGQWT